MPFTYMAVPPPPPPPRDYNFVYGLKLTVLRGARAKPLATAPRETPGVSIFKLKILWDFLLSLV